MFERYEDHPPLMLPLTGSHLNIKDLPTDEEFNEILNQVRSAGSNDINEDPAFNVCEREQPDGREIDEELATSCSSQKDFLKDTFTDGVATIKNGSITNDIDKAVNDGDIGPYVAISQGSVKSEESFDETNAQSTIVQVSADRKGQEDNLVILPVSEKPSYISVISSSQIVSKSR